MPTKPTTDQLTQLTDALLDAFPTYNELAAFTRVNFDINLELITFVKANLTTITSQLVEFFASQENGLKRLLAAALEERENKQVLIDLSTKWQTLTFEPIDLPQESPFTGTPQGASDGTNQRHQAVKLGRGSEYVGERCPVTQVNLEENDAVVICVDSNTAFRLDGWNEFCATESTCSYCGHVAEQFTATGLSTHSTSARTVSEDSSNTVRFDIDPSILNAPTKTIIFGTGEVSQIPRYTSPTQNAGQVSEPAPQTYQSVERESVGIPQRFVWAGGAGAALMVILLIRGIFGTGDSGVNNNSVNEIGTLTSNVVVALPTTSTPNATLTALVVESEMGTQVAVTLTAIAEETLGTQHSTPTFTSVITTSVQIATPTPSPTINSVATAVAATLTTASVTTPQAIRTISPSASPESLGGLLWDSHPKDIAIDLGWPPLSLTPSVDDQIRQAADKLESGTIVFTPPQTMRAGISKTVLASIIQSTQKEVVEKLEQTLFLAQPASEDGPIPTEAREINVNSLMNAKLTADPNDFEIIPQSPTQQSIGQTIEANWQWTVTPLRTGNKTLTLSVDAIVIVTHPDHNGDPEYPISIPAINRTINVTVNPVHTAKVALNQYWQGLTATLAAIFATLYLIVMRKRPKHTPAPALPNAKLQSLHAALVSAFPNETDLAQLTQYSLSQNLNQIADGDNQNQRVFNLLTWTEANGHTATLAQAAYNKIPTNNLLKQYIATYHPNLLQQENA